LIFTVAMLITQSELHWGRGGPLQAAHATGTLNKSAE